jgi:translocation and assembly module TamB
MKKTLLKKLCTIIILITLSSAFAIFIFNTNLGLRTIFALVPKILPGELRVTSFTGKLAGPITIQQFSYKNANNIITAENIYLDWNLKGLFSNTLHIKNFYATNLKLTIANDGVEKQKHIRFLPTLNLQVDDIKLNNITYKQKLHQIGIIDSVAINNTFYRGNHKWQLNALIKAKEAFLTINGGLLQNWQLHWQLNIPQINKICPTTTGAIKSSGDVIGPKKLPYIITSVNVDNFAIKHNTIQKFYSKIEFNTAKNSTSKIVLNAKRIQYNDIKIDNFKLNGDLNKITNNNAKLVITIDPFNVTLPTNSKIANVNFGSSLIQAQLDKKQLAIQTSLNLLKQNPLNVAVTLPNFKVTAIPKSSQKLHGKLTWQTNDCTLLKNFLPNTRNCYGQLKLNYSIDGTLAKPIITGDATVAKGSVEVPEYNLKLHNINLTTHQDINQITYQAKLYSGLGNLAIIGKTKLTNELLTTITINGENFLASNTSEYKISASPQLKLQSNNKQLFLSGKITIPYAEFNPNNYSSDSALPNEVVFVNTEKPISEPIFPLHSQIELVLGDKVTANISGFSGKIIGKIQVNDAPERPTTATGTFVLKNGYYNIYGQNLEVTDGNFQFTGSPLTNPNLNIRAIRKFNSTQTSFNNSMASENLIVGIQIRGTADNPKTDLFSIPSTLSKTDILSYLIIGQPTSQAQGNNIQLLFQAANALNFGGASDLNHVIDKLRQQFGFSDFGLTSEVQPYVPPTSQTPPAPNKATTPKTTTAFVLGKYLTPKIYISYSMGILEPVNIFRLRYLLGRYWSIQSENSSLGNGADLLFSIEH